MKNRNSTEIRISPSFSAPRITMGVSNEIEEKELYSTHSLLEHSYHADDANNNNACTSVESLQLSRSHLETQRLSPPLMPSQLRPHANSVCTSLLTPDVPKRSQVHRASDSHLLSDTFKQQQQERRPSQIRNSVIDQDLYWKTSEARHRSSLLTTPLASYIFVFISVLLTFSIVFAVGYLISSMTYRGGKSPRFMNSTFNDINSTTSTLEPKQLHSLLYNTSDDQMGRTFNSRLFFLPTNLN